MRTYRSLSRSRWSGRRTAPESNHRLTADHVRVAEADAVICQQEILAETVAAAAAGSRFFALHAAPAPGPLQFPTRLLEPTHPTSAAVGSDGCAPGREAANAGR